MRYGRWRRDMFALSEGLIVSCVALFGVCVTATASVIAARVAARVRSDTRELRNNGGSSLRDAVDRIEASTRQAEISAKVAVTVSERLAVQVSELRGDVHGVRRALDEHTVEDSTRFNDIHKAVLGIGRD